MNGSISSQLSSLLTILGLLLDLIGASVIIGGDHKKLRRIFLPLDWKERTETGSNKLYKEFKLFDDEEGFEEIVEILNTELKQTDHSIRGLRASKNAVVNAPYYVRPLIELKDDMDETKLSIANFSERGKFVQLDKIDRLEVVDRKINQSIQEKMHQAEQIPLRVGIAILLSGLIIQSIAQLIALN